MPLRRRTGDSEAVLEVPSAEREVFEGLAIHTIREPNEVEMASRPTTFTASTSSAANPIAGEG
jgi:hypothetical protein